MPSLNFIYSYPTGRKQRTEISSSYSSWGEKFFSVPQGSFLGPLLFNLYIYDLFYNIKGLEYVSFADDNTPCACSSDIISNLEAL